MIKLFDSLMRNYRIQTLLFWRTKDEIKVSLWTPFDWDADLSDFYDPTQSEEGGKKIFVWTVSSDCKEAPEMSLFLPAKKKGRVCSLLVG